MTLEPFLKQLLTEITTTNKCLGLLLKSLSNYSIKKIGWHGSEAQISNWNEQSYDIKHQIWVLLRVTVLFTGFRTHSPNRNHTNSHRPWHGSAWIPCQWFHKKNQPHPAIPDFGPLSSSRSMCSYSSLLHSIVLPITRWSSSAVHKWGRTGHGVKEQRQKVEWKEGKFLMNPLYLITLW